MNFIPKRQKILLEANHQCNQDHDWEGQFILRLPEEAAAQLKEVLDNCEPLKHRLGIKLENDMRHGEVRFDDWMFDAKLVNLPTIVESLKTYDRKNFYKSADICQLLLCKKKDSTFNNEDKTNKDFLWPHGITPPLKDVRKKRFRKQKKNPDKIPDVYKEVLRLLQSDMEAMNSTYSIIHEDENPSKPNLISLNEKVKVKVENFNDDSISLDEQEIFGGAISDSDEENKAFINNFEIDETLSLSFDNSHSAFLEQSTNESTTNKGPLVTAFTKEMFKSENLINVDKIKKENTFEVETKYDNEASECTGSEIKIKKETTSNYFAKSYSDSQNVIKYSDVIEERRKKLQSELTQLRTQKQQQEELLTNIENDSLRERFQTALNNLLIQEFQVFQELRELEAVN